MDLLQRLFTLSSSAEKKKQNRKFQTNKFDTVITHKDQISHAKSVSGNILVFFTVFGSWVRRSLKRLVLKNAEVPHPLCKSNAFVRATVGVVCATFGTMFRLAFYEYSPWQGNRRCCLRQIWDFSVALTRGGVLVHQEQLTKRNRAFVNASNVVPACDGVGATSLTLYRKNSNPLAFCIPLALTA